MNRFDTGAWREAKRCNWRADLVAPEPIDPPRDPFRSASNRKVLRIAPSVYWRPCQRHSGMDTTSVGIGTSDLVHRGGVIAVPTAFR